MLNNKNLILLLTPSWLVSVIGLTAGVLIAGSTIVLAQFTGSELRRQIFEVQNTQDAVQPSTGYQAITDNFANNSFLSALPLLLTWALVGLAVYFVASAIVKMIKQAVDLREQMDYVHASRDGLKKEAILHLGIRLTALVGWFVFIKLTLSVIVPYALAASYAAAHDFSLQSILDVCLAIAVIYGATWVHAIFLRLITLKPRLFGNF
jgi:hypothetical protein